MKKNYLLLSACLIFCVHLSVDAQNLVPNNGFELQDSCPAVSEIFVAPPWSSPTLGTPDLFNNSCTSQQGSPKTGVGSAGFYTYSTFADNREYLQVQLTAPLVAGQTYIVSFYAKRLTFFTYAVDRIGAYLGTTELTLSTTSALISYSPQVENPAGNVLTGTGYTLISGSFVASGGEEFLLIGNFENDANTTILDVESNGNMKSYYYIDDVSVTHSTVGLQENQTSQINLEVYPSPSNGLITIQISDDVPLSEISFDITDMNGRVVLNDQYGDDTKKTIDLSNLEKGIYMVRVYAQETFVSTKRIIIN